MWHFWLQSDRKTLHNTQILLTLTSNKSMQARQGRGSQVFVPRWVWFAWADFPFKHPVRQTDHLAHSWTTPDLSQSNQAQSGRKFIPGKLEISPSFTIFDVRHAQFSRKLNCVIASSYNKKFRGVCLEVKLRRQRGCWLDTAKWSGQVFHIRVIFTI